MASIIKTFENVEVKAGNVDKVNYWNGSSWDSGRPPFARPSYQNGYNGGRFMRCDFGVSVAVADDLSVFVSINGGNIKSNKLFNATEDTQGWPRSMLCAGLKSYNIVIDGNHKDTGFYIQQGSWKNWIPWGLGDNEPSASDMSENSVNLFFTKFGIYCPPTGGTAEGHSTHDPSWGASDWRSKPSKTNEPFPASTKITEGTSFSSRSEMMSSMKSSGYTYIGLLGNSEWAGDETERTGYIYVSGVCMFNESDSPDKGDATIPPYKVEITGIRELLNYYPWARFDGSKWVSHNANGHSLKRYNGSAWVDVKNSFSSDSSKSKGFRHDGSRFAKSPKHGEGA